MKIFRDKTDYDGTVVALGNFDGLHIAHMTIIRNGIKYAKEYRRYAFNIITNTTADYSYNESTGNVQTKYTYSFKPLNMLRLLQKFVFCF